MGRTIRENPENGFYIEVDGRHLKRKFDFRVNDISKQKTFILRNRLNSRDISNSERNAIRRELEKRNCMKKIQDRNNISNIFKKPSSSYNRRLRQDLTLLDKNSGSRLLRMNLSIG